MAAPSPLLSLPLQDRVAIVTGSSRGIGKAIAIHLASLGAKLVINYTSNKEQADLVANDINSSCVDNTPRAIVAQANVSDPAQVKFLFDEAERVFGSQLHILVNCAGVLDPKYPSIPNTSLEDFDHIFRYFYKPTKRCLFTLALFFFLLLFLVNSEFCCMIA
jgi:3-oxoacyl-[acyl-carrier protein] reductase